VNRIACIIVVLVAGCSFDEAALHTVGLDAAGSTPPGRGPAGNLDAGVDVLTVPDVQPQTSDVLSRSDTLQPDTLQSPDSMRDVQVSEAPGDAQVISDGLSSRHDVVVTDAVPCMQQVVANGYASAGSACAEAQNVSACVAMIDCFLANRAMCSTYVDCTVCRASIPNPPPAGLIATITRPFCPGFI